MSDSNQVVEPQLPAAQPAPKPDTKPKIKGPGELPPYHVVLLDDNEHTYEYVIDMLQSLLSHSEEQAFLLAEQVDRTGRAVVCTTHKERAELKRDQILGFGCDFRISSSKNSMKAVIEPAEG
ncbi:MAG TPA: ATP-dependent Clp protease adaptor ClpS [Tepidisphaeraceae bacterium]|jgi:ATP-dependent Clp protease adaptor protein ClpS